MSKSIWVVAMAPIPVPLHNGRHLAPGQITQVEDNEVTRRDIARGVLNEIIREKPFPIERKPRVSTPEPSQENQ